MLNSLQSYRPTKTHAFWIAVGGIVAMLIVGFGPLGWTTEGTAAKRASDAALEARQELAAAVCVDQFMKSADAKARFETLRNASHYNRADVIANGGWATMPDRKQPNSVVASMCAGKLADLQSPST